MSNKTFKGAEEQNQWSRDKARKLYGSAGMVAPDRQETFMKCGSEMTHQYPDMTREPKKAKFEDDSGAEKY